MVRVRCSLSAVSKPNFARKYALERSRRDLHNALLCTVLQSQFFRQKSPKLFRDWINEYSLIHSQTLRILRFLARIFDDFFSRISRQIPENSDVCRFFNQICENKLESCRKFWNLWELLTIIQNYSLVSLGVVLGFPRWRSVGERIWG